MSIPLDDLLPSNDECFEPVDSGVFFLSGSPFWEWADEFKWIRPTGEHGRELFKIGWEAAMFETLLKSGLSFSFTAYALPQHALESRAKQFGRVVVRHGTEERPRHYVVSRHSR
jgi:hypothetical protein